MIIFILYGGNLSDNTNVRTLWYQLRHCLIPYCPIVIRVKKTRGVGGWEGFVDIFHETLLLLVVINNIILKA